MSNSAPDPGYGAALLPLIVLLGVFALGSFWLEPGSSLALVALLTAALVAGIQARRRGVRWADLGQRTGEKFTAVLPAITILLAIGVLIGTWVLSGTIPMLVSLGIRWIDPQFFALSAFLATALMSLCTGTSWGSAGTLGVALMGTAAVLDVSLPMAAGAVVSGAYLGDKLSPLSDTTNVCALAAGTPLYTHVRFLLYTVIPSFVACVLVFGWMGLAQTQSGQSAQALQFAQEIDSAFALGPATGLPVLWVLTGIVLRWPPVWTLLGGAALASLIGVTIQGFSPGHAVTAAVDGFRVDMLALDSPPSPLLIQLLERGGLMAMAGTLVLILSAFLLAAGLERSGSLDRIVGGLLTWARDAGRLILATLASGGVLIALTSHASVTALMLADLYRDNYRRMGLAPENLSRNTEDSVTITEPLMPWTVSALFMATTLGVPTLEYAPWAVFCYGGPVFAVLYALGYSRTGFGIRPTPHLDGSSS